MAKKSREEKMLTAREVATRIGAAYSSVRIWAKEGRFAGAQLIQPPAGLPYWLIPESAIEGYETRGVGRPAKPKEEKTGASGKASRKPAAKAAKRSRKGQ
jgi:hypothetical protein